LTRLLARPTQILINSSRISLPRLAPLVFLIKQTAVPAGLLISGFLAPAMASALGWRGAALITAAACVAFTGMLQPLRPLRHRSRAVAAFSGVRFSNHHRVGSKGF
jgi:hypothetical protein